MNTQGSRAAAEVREETERKGENILANMDLLPFLKDLKYYKRKELIKLLHGQRGGGD